MAVPGPSIPYAREPVAGVTCLPQRAALLKSMLNFLKKAIQDSSFSDSIRHVMDGSLPAALKHIISNAEYYGTTRKRTLSRSFHVSLGLSRRESQFFLLSSM